MECKGLERVRDPEIMKEVENKGENDATAKILFERISGNNTITC